MKHFYFFFIVFVFCLSFSQKIISQNNKPYFENYTSEKGLAQNNVRGMFQDEKGFLWFATQNGLSRYDGYTFINYKHNPNNKNSIIDNFVISVTGDKKGTIWLLTAKGVSKIHLPTGKITNYPSGKTNEQKIVQPDLEHSKMFLDSKGFIYVDGHYLGDKRELHFISILDTKTDKIENISPITQDHILYDDMKNTDGKSLSSGGNFWEDENGKVYIGFSEIDIKNKKVKNLLYNSNMKGAIDFGNKDAIKILKDKKNTKNYGLIAITGGGHSTIDKYNNIWFGTQNGDVYCFMKATKKLIYYPQWVEKSATEKRRSKLKHNSLATVKSMYIDKNTQTLYIGLYGAGAIIKVDLAEEYTFNSSQNFDEYGRLVRYGFIKKQFLMHEPTNPNGLSLGTVMTMFIDKSSCLWVGITENGVYKYAPYKQKFDKFTAFPSDTNTLLSNNVLTFFKNKNQQLFIGSGLGVQEYIAQDNRFQKIQLAKTKDGEYPSKIHAFAEDNQNNLYIGTWGLGIYEYNTQTKQSKSIPFDKTKDEFNQPLAWCNKLWYDSLQHKLWSCDWGNGIGYIDLKNKNISYVSLLYETLAKKGTPVADAKKQKHGLAMTLLPTKQKDGKFWIGHDRNEPLRLFNRNTLEDELSFKVSENKDSLKNTTIHTILYDKKERLWVGTDDGLCVYDEQKGTWKTYNTKHGIPDENINGILIDKKGFFWLATGNGLCKFDTEKEKSILVLTINEGLPANTLTSTYQDNEGVFYVGSAKGFVRFDPEKLIFNTQRPSAFLNKLKINDKNINLDSLVYLSKKIYFKRHQNDISFYLSSTDFNLISQNKFQVKLEGYNTDWIDLGTRNIAVYTNLPHGKYKLKVKCTNNDGVWSDETTLFEFEILPAWYETWLAFIIFIILFISLIGLAFRQRIIYLEAQKVKLQQKVDEQTAELLEKNEELNQQNEEISQQRDNLHELNEEILQQSEELKSQSELILQTNDILEQKNLHITQSIEAAKEVQKAIFPNKTKWFNTLPQSFIFFKPKDIVSGDFYYLAENDTKKIMAVVDCTGHGAPGALMTMLGNALLNEIIHLEKITDADKILNSLNKKMYETLDFRNDYGIRSGMDMSILVYEKNTNILQFAGAGNAGYFVDSDNISEVQIIPAHRRGIGTEIDTIFEQQTINLTNKNMVFYLTSDGFQDQFGGKKQNKFMKVNLKKLLLSIHHLPFEEQKEILQQNFLDWKQDIEQTDDVCLVGVKFG